MAVIETTDRCNLACSYCPKSKGIGIGSRVIEHEQFVKIYDNLTNGVRLKFVSLVGFGEPLINKNIHQAVEYVKQKTPKATISITTNGILYDFNMAKKLSDAGLSQMIVSLNLATKEIYLKYNLEDYFDRIMNNLKSIAENKKQIKTKIFVQLLDIQDNRPYINTIQELIESFGFNFILKPFLNWGGEIEIKNENSKFKVMERYPCANIEQYLWVHLNGDVQVCCVVIPKSNSELIIGNILKQTAKEILNGNQYKKLEELNSTVCLSCIDECKECNAWAEIPNIYLKIGNKWY